MTDDKIKTDPLRKKMKALRDAIPADIRLAKSLAIAEMICACPWYDSTDCFFVYSSIKSEVDLDYFCEKAWNDGKSLFFPKVDGKEMDFYLVNDFVDLDSGAYGVMEPNPLKCRLANVEEEKSAILLAPGVAFTTEGYRIGYGGGYYDRYLYRKPEVYPVGICFEMQLTTDFVPMAHDMKMKEVITENHRHTI